MKYCCEKCFSKEKSFHDYLVNNHEKVGNCDYCGEKDVKLIDVAKMRTPFLNIIEDKYYVVDKSEVSCMGEDYYVVCDEYPVDSLSGVFEYLEDDNEWQLDERLFYDACDDDDDKVFYLLKSSIPDEIKKNLSCI